MEKIQAGLVQGTRDFGPDVLQKRKYILNIIETQFRKYGFMPLETPAMEKLQTLTGKYGEEGDRLLYKILNSGDAFKDIKERNIGRKIEDIHFPINDICEKGLRYDLTVPFARFVTQNQHLLTFPFRRYQMQAVWRADRPQKGRYREFWQCDADIIGSNSLFCELDLLNIYHEVFSQLNLHSYIIRLNNRKLLYAIACHVKNSDSIETIAIALDKLDKIGEEGVRKELSSNGFSTIELDKLFDIINIKGSNIEKLQNLRSLIAYIPEGEIGLNEIEFIFNQLNSAYKQLNISFDISLARGLSYYTGCIMEVIISQADSPIQSSVGGGGRYDNLTEIFGLKGMSGMGISFGLDRIYDVLDGLKLFPDEIKPCPTKVLFCYFDDMSQTYAYSALTALRDAGISAEIYPDITKKIGKQIDYASSLSIPFVAISGTNEINTQTFMFKDLESGKQESLTISQIINLLKK